MSIARNIKAHSCSLPLVHDFELHLLDLGQSLELLRDQVVDLLVQLPDFEFGLEVDLIVVERAQPVLRLLPLLAHHDDRRLDRGDGRQDQIEQDEGIAVERAARPERC